MARGKKRSYTVPLIVIASIIVLLSSGIMPLGIGLVKDVNNYGTVTIQSLYGGENGGLGLPIDPMDTIAKVDGLAVIWRPDPAYSGEIGLRLNLADGTWQEQGNWNLNTNVDPYIHLWGFTLDSLPEGTTEVYCYFYDISQSETTWHGATFHFYVYSITGPAPIVIQFTTEQMDTSTESGQATALTWWFVSEGQSSAKVWIDGVSAQEWDIQPLNFEQPVTFMFSQVEEGEYSVKLTVDPEYGDYVESSCVVTVTETSTTTTTTTTNTTTTTTTTPPPPPPPDAPDYTILLMAVGGAIVVVLVLTRRK